jgi:hypothetical protein
MKLFFENDEVNNDKEIEMLTMALIARDIKH